MKKVTKASIQVNLETSKNGQIKKSVLNEMTKLFDSIKPNEKFFYISHKGKGRNTRTYSLIDLDLLKQFTTFSKGNDAPRGGVVGNWISLNRKEYKTLLKRLNYFIDVDGLLKEIEDKKNKDILEAQRLEEARKNKRSFFLGHKSTDDITVVEWLNLPKKFKHPAPQKIYDLKNESGLGWKEFEDSLEESLAAKNKCLSLSLIEESKRIDCFIPKRPDFLK